MKGRTEWEKGEGKNDNKKGREVKGSGQGWGGGTVKDEEQASLMKGKGRGGTCRTVGRREKRERGQGRSGDEVTHW